MWVSTLLLASVFCHSEAQYGLPGSPDIRTPAADDVPYEPPECPAQGIHHFPDERICDGFYQCIDGERKHKLCPTGELFSPADPSTPCADAADVVCPPLLLPPLVPRDVPECGGLSWKHLPDPDDCAAFFECRGGKASWRSCPKDLLYNAHSPATRYPCDYPFNVQCVAPHAPPVPPPWGHIGPVPPPRGPPVPVSPTDDRQSDNSTKVFNFYTYVTHNW
ncbi:protein obstructor-E-like isoform X2 [Portunus trituberculatus]|uniref:protein obstructor-E-like isoform X2 n=1 Tax=Portunus trituberculatus TaxID=210409 RepID=UPI001E1CC9B5|nr:protein obstructor-E-like isoform X2 [Portunus trituberculatus]